VVKLVSGVVRRLSVIGFSLLIDFGTVLSFDLSGFGQVDQRVKLETIALY
jgi:hypothetical protein